MRYNLLGSELAAPTCGLTEDLTGTVMYPLALVGALVGLAILTFNNISHGRKYYDTQLAHLGDLEPGDQRRTVLGAIPFIGSFILTIFYSAITTYSEQLFAHMGLCKKALPGVAMWPPTVVFSLLTLTCLFAYFAKPVSHRTRTALGAATWGFFSLTVGFAVAVFTTDPNWLVWPPVCATLLPVASSLLAPSPPGRMRPPMIQMNEHRHHRGYGT